MLLNRIDITTKEPLFEEGTACNLTHYPLPFYNAAPNTYNCQLFLWLANIPNQWDIALENSVFYSELNVPFSKIIETRAIDSYTCSVVATVAGLPDSVLPAYAPVTNGAIADYTYCNFWQFISDGLPLTSAGRLHIEILMETELGEQGLFQSLPFEAIDSSFTNKDKKGRREYVILRSAFSFYDHLGRQYNEVDVTGAKFTNDMLLNATLTFAGTNGEMERLHKCSTAATRYTEKRNLRINGLPLQAAKELETVLLNGNVEAARFNYAMPKIFKTWRNNTSVTVVPNDSLDIEKCCLTYDVDAELVSCEKVISLESCQGSGGVIPTNCTLVYTAQFPLVLNYTLSGIPFAVTMSNGDTINYLSTQPFVVQTMQPNGLFPFLLSSNCEEVQYAGGSCVYSLNEASNNAVLDIELWEMLPNGTAPTLLQTLTAVSAFSFTANLDRAYRVIVYANGGTPVETSTCPNTSIKLVL